MSEGKRTPGPWRAWEPDSPQGKWQIDAASGPLLPEKKIATIHRGSLRGDCSHANARLIAAAPDLLEALQAIIVAADYFEQYRDNNNVLLDAIDNARAAIRKAEGVPSDTTRFHTAQGE